MSFPNFHPEPRIELVQEKKLVGRCTTMSFAHNTTFTLWQQFMPLRKQLEKVIGNDLYSVEVYPAGFFNNFLPDRLFKKWAAVEVSEYAVLPAGLEKLLVPAGWYAVFLHKGPASEGSRTYEYIFRHWLPASLYTIDERPHFALMGEKYKHEDPASEEEIWIPVKKI